MDTLLWEVSGRVGEGHAAALVAYLKVKERLPDLREIVNGKYNVAPARDDLALAWNIVQGLYIMFRGATGKDREKVAKGMTRYFLDARNTTGYSLDNEWITLGLRDAFRLDAPALRRGAGGRWAEIAKRLMDSTRYSGDVDLTGIGA